METEWKDWDRKEFFTLLEALGDDNWPFHVEMDENQVVLLGKKSKTVLKEIDIEMAKSTVGYFQKLLQQHADYQNVKTYLTGLNLECCGTPMSSIGESHGIPLIGMQGETLGGGLGDIFGGLFGGGTDLRGFPIAMLVCFECGHFRLYSRRVILSKMETQTSG